MYALARACCFERYRNWGSGLSRNGNSLSLKGSRYMGESGVAMLRDAYGHGQITRQPPRARIAQGGGRLDERAVTQLAARAGALAVVVQVHARVRQQRRACGHPPDEIDHGRIPARARRAERQIEDRAQMVLELTGGRALDGPVPGIVNARGHLVGYEASAAHEELERQDPGVAEMGEYALEVTRREALPARRPERRAGEAQDPGTVHVAAQRIDRELPAGAARADDHGLPIEDDPLLVRERHVAPPADGPTC